jgi:hypothetical protein
VHETLSGKTLHKNRAGGVAQGEGPEFKLNTRKKKKKTLQESVCRRQANGIVSSASGLCRLWFPQSILGPAGMMPAQSG